MNTLKVIASFVGAAGLSLSISLPSVAQTSPARDGMMPGMTAPGSMSPGMMNSPRGMQGSTYQPAVSIPASQEPMSIASIVDGSESFEMLNALLRVAAIKDPGLASELAGSGEFTVFAPTDEAFAALPPEAVRALVQPENRDLLIRVLSYHIVPGKISSSDIASANLGRDIDTGLTPPSGEQRPNENVGAVQEENLSPNADSDSGEAAGFSDSRQASAPASGEQRPNENTGNVIREDLAPSADTPNRTQDQMAMGQQSGMSNPGGMAIVPQTQMPASEMSSPGGMSSGMSSGMSDEMSGDMSAMDMGSSENQAMEPASGEQRPNENTANVQGETLVPNADRDSMGMGMGMGMDRSSSGMGSGASISAARVIGADIEASNGVIHAINRVILSPELQAEVQEAVSNLN